MSGEGLGRAADSRPYGGDNSFRHPASRRPANTPGCLLLPLRGNSPCGAAAEIEGGATGPVRSGEQNALRGGEKPFGLMLILRFFDRCGKAIRKLYEVGNRTPCGARKTLRAYADPRVFRPLRKLRAPFIRRWRREPSILNNSKFGRERLYFEGRIWYSGPIERRDR